MSEVYLGRINRNKLVKLTWPIFILMICSPLLSSCGPAEDERYGGTLKWGAWVTPVNLNPLTSNLIWDDPAIYNLFEGLVKYSDDSFEIIPALAEKWTQSNDGLTWTFELKGGVKFHDGTVFNAEAVVFHFKRLLEPDHPYHPPDSRSDLFFDLITQVKATTPLTVTFTLIKPYCYFLDLLAEKRNLIV